MSNQSPNNEQQLPTLHQLLSQQEYVPEQPTSEVTPKLPEMEKSEEKVNISASDNPATTDHSSPQDDSEKHRFILQWARRKALLDYYKIEK